MMPSNATAVAASRCPKRSAVQSSGGMQRNEEEDGPDVVERVPPTREAVQQHGADHALEGIAQGDGEGGRERARGADIDEEGAHEDDGPDAQAQDEEGRERDARGRPHGGGTGVQGGEVQAELAGQEIDEPDGRRERDAAGSDRHREAPIMGVRYTNPMVG
jgi:hypothetical protein